MRSALLMPFLLLATPALAQSDAPRVEVQLSSFDFAPKVLQLKAGQPVVLHLVNTGKGGHNFSAPQFFAAAAHVSGPVKAGTVEVAGNSSADVTLTPARGAYKLRCTHTLHAGFGMKGSIVVE